MRRDFHEHMDMFSRQNAGYNLDAQFLAHLPDNRSYPLPQRAFQHLVAILRDPDDVVPMVKNRVTPACVAVTVHLPWVRQVPGGSLAVRLSGHTRRFL